MKIASQCMEDTVQITLYVHVLSNYLYFYEDGCDEVGFSERFPSNLKSCSHPVRFQIRVDTMNQLIEKIRDALLQLDPSPEADQLNETFKLMLQHIRHM